MSMMVMNHVLAHFRCYYSDLCIFVAMILATLLAPCALRLSLTYIGIPLRSRSSNGHTLHLCQGSAEGITPLNGTRVW